MCCALPSLLVVVGLGATVASLASSVPWLVTLSRHKAWVFAGAGLMIAASVYYVYGLTPRLLARGPSCPPDDLDACAQASRWSRALLWASAAVYGTGLFVAYVLGPILRVLQG